MKERSNKYELLEELPKDAKQIPNVDEFQYADPNGSIYVRYNQQKHLFLKKKPNQMKNGYYEIGVKVNGKMVTKRLNRVIAQTFIPNPNNYPVVMHINNIKTDNRIENLKWGTISENTQQAFDDGLQVNDKGYEDSQSMPVILYDKNTHEELERFGSMHEASRKTGYRIQNIRYHIANADRLNDMKLRKLKGYFKLDPDYIK